MNKFNTFLVKLFLLPKNLYIKLGCDTHHLKAILSLKLMMDDRRPNAFNQMKRQQAAKKLVSNATIWGMLGSFITGLFFLMVFAVSNDAVSALSLFFSLFITLLALTLITDFTSVLLDVRDNFIILPKPVSDITFVVAKLLHIIIHISKMVLPLTLPSLIYIGVTEGFYGVLIMLPLIALATIFTVFIINAFYLFILKVTTPEKFKNIISYIQIAFAICVYAASQILPRMIGKTNGSLDIKQYSWVKVTPFYWFANSYNTLFNLSFTAQNCLFLALTIIVPIASIWLIVKYFAPSFNQKLSQLASSGSNETTTIRTTALQVVAKNKYSSWWAKKITVSANEKMGFLFTWKMMLRSRDFKLKAYPGIGYMIVILVVIFFQNKNLTLNNVEQQLAQQTASGKLMILLTIYFSSLVIITALGTIVMSDKYKAAWLYFVTPIQQPGLIIAGAIKAVTVMFFGPFVLIAVCLGISLIGFSALPNILLAICNQLFIITIMAIASIRFMPFSIATYKPNSSSVIKNLFMMLIGFLVGLMHYFIYDITWLILVLVPVSLTATYFLFKTIIGFSWDKILSEYQD